MDKAIKNRTKKLPGLPGVYLFRNKRGNILYIGKAADIKKRVKSHFSKPPFREAQFNFLNEVKKIDYRITDSEIEALLLESALIRKHMPPYNTMWRDDKNYFYVGITNEKYPRVFLTHQVAAAKIKNKKSKIKNTNKKLKNGAAYMGPFVDGRALKTTLKALRRIFPYRTCGKIPHRACMWFDINKKETPCEGTMEPKKYRDVIRNFSEFLAGKKHAVLKRMRKEMKQASKNQAFEKAAEMRDQIFAIQNVLYNAQVLADSQTIAPFMALRELKQLLNLAEEPRRIEGYDISNIQGKEATGSMVVFQDGEPDKNQYRKFKIKIAGIPNDVAMLRETISRRIAHHEWQGPDLMLIDGGSAQLRAARSALGLKSYKQKFAIVALAKRQNLLYLEIPRSSHDNRDPGAKRLGTQKNLVPMKNLPPAARNLLTRIRDEAHRFAVTYHRKLHRKTFTE